MTLAISHGEVYPAFIEALRSSPRRKGLSDESVNVAAGVAATEGGWIGLNLWVMCPSKETAKQVIPALMAVLASYELTGTADGALAMLTTALEGQEPLKDSDLWPKNLPALVTRGVRSASRT